MRRRLKRFFRRLLLAVIGLCLIAGAVYGYMRYVEPNWLQVTHLEVTSPHVEETFTAAVFADTHIGMGKDLREMRRLAEEIEAYHPDALFFLGDLFDDYEDYEGDADAVLDVFASIDASYKYAVRGNHDVGGGAQFVYEGLLERCGFTLLEDEEAWLPGNIHLIGANDMLYFKTDVSGLITDGFDLLLAHEPDLADGLTGAELQLSGHTHGGQIYIPFLRGRILPRGGKHYYRGRYEKSDGGIVYVNRGYGMSLAPLRLFSRPELTILTIRGE